MDSIFFRKDYEDQKKEKVKGNSKIQAGMGFAFFSALFLMLCTLLPFYGATSSFFKEWIPLIEYGYQGYLVFGVGILAFTLNYLGKHGWAAFCGGTTLALWVGHFLFKTFEPFFVPEAGIGYRYERLLGYWVLPIAAGLVLYSSLALWKKERKQKAEE